ncbi:CHRD domain-containing protein [Pseudoduganella sp. GCM10020061]|uniref:CHRD domain-containing protein n=1 Tax=Pseudoduganella sp. GCM10020061 TaxID=3317345 RepID=UPI00362BB30C
MKRILTMLVLAAAALFAPAAMADISTFRSTMSGPSEVPPNPSPGYGVAEIVIDDVAHTMTMMIPFNDLLGGTTAAHIHCCVGTPLDPLGVAAPATETPTLSGFPLGVTSGVYNVTMNLLDPTTYSTAFLTANGGSAASAEAAFIAGILGNTAYLNIHTNLYPGGEIRGYLVNVAVIPEPSQWMMLSLGLFATGLAVRRARRK